MADANRPWDLITFVEAVSVELDRARDLSRLKSEAGRPLTYLVKDLSINLNVFPQYDGKTVTFRTAGPNEQGASELKLELASATAPVVEQTTKAPPRAGEVRVEDLPIDQETRDSLRNIGVESKDDVERLRDVKVKTARGGEVDFTHLADLMDKATGSKRPKVRDVVSFGTPGNGGRLRVLGEHMDRIAADRIELNGRPVEATVTPEHVELSLPSGDGGYAGGELLLETVDGDRLRLLLEEALRDET